MKLFVILVILLGLKVNCWAIIPAEQKVLDIESVTPVAPKEEMTTQDIAKYIPTNIEPGTDGEDVGMKIVKQATKSLLKSDAIKQSSLGKTADTLKEGVNTEIHTTPSADPEETQHKVKFKLDPIKTLASVKYSGFFNAQGVYIMDENTLKVEITEKLYNQYDLVVSHDVNQDMSLMQVRWSWDPK